MNVVARWCGDKPYKRNEMQERERERHVKVFANVSAIGRSGAERSDSTGAGDPPVWLYIHRFEITAETIICLTTRIP